MEGKRKGVRKVTQMVEKTWEKTVLCDAYHLLLRVELHMNTSLRRMRVGVVDVGGGVREGGGSRGLGVCGGLCCCVGVCTDGRQTKNT